MNEKKQKLWKIKFCSEEQHAAWLTNSKKKIYAHTHTEI